VSVIGQPVGGIRATPEGEEPYIPSSPEADGKRGWWEGKALRVSRRSKQCRLCTHL